MTRAVAIVAWLVGMVLVASGALGPNPIGQVVQSIFTLHGYLAR